MMVPLLKLVAELVLTAPEIVADGLE